MLEIDHKAIEEIQRAYCEANHIYCTCVGRELNKITSFNGTQQEAAFYEEKFPIELQKKLLHSFVDGDVENVIELENEDEYILICGVAIRGEQKELLGIWLVFGVDMETIPEDEYVPLCVQRTTRTVFDDAVGLLETLSKYYFLERLRAHNLEENLETIAESERQKEYMLRKNEVLTEILKMLESENEFSKISEDILMEVGKYLAISSSALYRINADDATVDMICEWNVNMPTELIGEFQKTSKEELPFLTGRPYTISSETLIPKAFTTFFHKYDITAGVFLPLDISGKTGMYLAFMMIGETKKWSVEELKFLHDVKRIMQTILVKRITKNSLASSYAALEAILENTGCGVSINDLKNQSILYTNDTFKQMFEQEEDFRELQQLLMDAEKEGNTPEEYYARKSERWYEVSYTKIHWVDGREVRLATVYDITHIKRYQKKIEHQANVDYLTGLYNRMRCEEDLKEQIRSAVRAGGQGALLYLDLDDFKNINDGLGHNCGDILLKDVSNALQEIKGIGGNCYRVGGDEFAVLISHNTYENLEYVEKRIKDMFSRPWYLSGTEYYCTMSMGVVSFPKDGVDVGVLLQRADIALYGAKQKGKNRIADYNEQTVSSPIRRLDLEKNLREAVRNGCDEFEVNYQPIIKTKDGQRECCGAEALVRWNSSALGFLMPGDFIPLAEYLGLIVSIGEHVLNEACDRCKYWNDFGHPEYKVNVNFSVVQLLQNNFIETIQQALERSGLTPSNLTLEMTEGLAINDMSRMKMVLTEIREMGVRVALDDFGTGYSSLNHIQHLPLDVIKIDRSFVMGLGDDPFSEAFVKTVSELADTIQVNVCVEGVEEEQQCDMLENMKIDMLQGFLFDRPIPVDEFEQKYLFT